MMKCCVEGCDNAYTPDNPYLAQSISFHLFPRNMMLKQKWLSAIGRTDWNPPATAYVCNRHFSSKQMDVSDPSEHKIKEDGYPDCALPAKSCISEQLCKLKVCRFCLATNVKMFSLETEVLKSCIVGLHENYNVEGLPQYSCYICTAYLFKMYNAIEKSVIAQATVMEIYSESPELTESNIFESNREKLHLAHTLQSHNETPCKVYEYVYDENLNTSILISVKSESDRKEDENGSEDMIDSEVDLTAKGLSKLYMMLTQDIKESEDLLTDTYCNIHINKDMSKTHDNSNTELNNKHIKDKNAKIKDINKKLLVQKQNGVQINMKKSDNIKDTNKKMLVQEQNIVRKGSNKTVNKIKDMNKKIRKQNVRKGSNVSDNKTKDTNKKLQVQEHNIVQTGSNESDNDNIKSKNGMFAYENDHDYLHAYAVDKFGVKTDIIIKNTIPPVPENKNEKSVRSTIPNDNLNVAGVRTADRDETISSIKPRNDIVGSNTTALITDHVHNDHFHTVILPLEEQKEQWSRAMEQRANRAELQRCRVCSKWVRRGIYYAHHVARHDPKYGAYECEVCKVRFFKDDLRERHMQVTHSRKYTCKFCSKVLYTLGTARHHARQHARPHARPPARPHSQRVHRCSLCRRTCRSGEELLRHVANHHHTALLPMTSSESQPAPSDTEPGVRKPKQPPQILTTDEKQIVYNMYKHFEKNSVTYPFKTQLYEIIAQIVGLSNSCVQKMISPIEKAQETQPKVPTSESQPYPSNSPSRSTSPSSQIKKLPTIRERRIMFNLYKHLEKASVAYPFKGELYEITSQIMGFGVASVRRTILQFEEKYQRKQKQNKVVKKRLVACPACSQRFPSQRAQREHLASCPGKLSKRKSSKCNSAGPAGCELRSTRLKRKEQSKSRDEPEEMSPIEVAYECPICDEVFKTAAMMNQHILTVHQQTQLTKFGESHKENSGDGMDIRSGIDNKGRKVRDDSETDTCSEGEEFDNQEMAGSSYKDSLPPECYLEEEYYPIETLDMDALGEDIF